MFACQVFYLTGLRYAQPKMNFFTNLKKKKIFYILIACVFILFFFPVPWIVAIVILIMKYKSQINIPVWVDIIFWLLPVIVLMIFWVSTYSWRKKVLQEIEFLKENQTFDDLFLDPEGDGFVNNSVDDCNTIDAHSIEEIVEKPKTPQIKSTKNQKHKL